MRIQAPCLLMALLAAGCSDAPVGTPEALRRDSAAVQIVEHPPGAVDALPTWRLADTPAVRIGALEGAEEYRFYRIGGSLELPGDTLLVVNAGSQELRFYDGEGRFVRSVGGRGEGPGEFAVPTVVWERADSLVIWDARLHRLSYFDHAGRFLRLVTPGRASANPELLGVFEDGSFLIQDLWLSQVNDDMNPQYLHFARFGATGEFLDSLPTKTWGLIGRLGDSGLVGGPLFDSKTVTAGDTRSYWTSPGDAPEVSRHAPDGSLTQIVRWSEEPRAVTDAQIDRYWGERMAAFQDSENSNALRQTEELRRSMPVAETFPVVSALQTTREGGLWIQRYHAPVDEGPEEWLIVAPDGTLSARIFLPENFRILEVAGGSVAGVETDELDVERYVRYPVVTSEVGGGRPG